MNKALLPLLLCCFIFPASGKDAGWQWYNEKINPKEKENKPVPAAPRQEPDIMQKLAALQTATKRALYEAILYPGVDNFVKYFRLQNYWAQQAGLFTMSARKAMLAHPELDYNLQYSHYNGTVRNQLAADQAQQRQAIAKLAEHYGIMFFYRGQDPIDGQLAQVINGFRDTYGLSVIPVSVDGVINPLLPDYRSVSMQRVRLQRHNRKWPGRRRTEPKVPCMVSAAVLPVPGTHSVSLALTGGAVTLSLVVLTAR
ncbi:type-F conjugative transfer system pilin assembly protein TraF [Escherichia coli]